MTEKWILYFRLNNGDELYLCNHTVSGGYSKKRTLCRSLALTFPSRKAAVKRIETGLHGWYTRRIN